MIHIKEYTGIEDARQEVYFFTKRHGGIFVKHTNDLCVEFSYDQEYLWKNAIYDIMFAEIWQRIKRFL